MYVYLNHYDTTNFFRLTGSGSVLEERYPQHLIDFFTSKTFANDF
jgi:hypothetical protein